ncbi:MAG: hypothetical protein ACRD0Z_02310 [Acidimicrobiales bacterium]
MTILPPTVFAQVRMWSRRQWQLAIGGFVVSFLLMGTIGETLPGASGGRGTPVEWWNYLTLVVSPMLIGSILGTFTPRGQPNRSRLKGATGAGFSAAVGTVAMACPVCNPLAIAVFGAGGILSFLAPERGLVALLSVVLLAVTLLLRLRTTRACLLSYAESSGSLSLTSTVNSEGATTGTEADGG